MHQNIDGLLNKSDILTVHIHELLDRQINIDILCITVHFIMSGQESLVEIPNYKLSAFYSRDNIKRGGSCILVKKGIEYETLTEISKYSLSGIMECCAIKLTKFNLIVICIYRPPKPCNLYKFYENQEVILKKSVQ